MAKRLNPTDVHAVVNKLARNLTGQSNLVVTDTGSLVTVGETLMARFTTENIINQIGIIVGDTIIASRPYDDKLSIITAGDKNIFKNRARKISYYSKDALESGAYNTDLNTNFAEGYDNGTNGGSSTKNQYEQHLPDILTEYFGGVGTYQECITMLEDKLEQAFTSEASFAEFIAGFVEAKQNDIKMHKEAGNRAALLNHIGMVAKNTAVMEGSYVDLVAAYNDAFGTSYTGDELRSTYLKSFLEFTLARMAIDSDKMTYRTALFHNAATKNVGGVSYSVLRHTPKADQKTVLYGPLFEMAKTLVNPEIFNVEYLQAPNSEKVSFWQNPKTPAEINIKPDYLDTVSGAQVTSNDAVNIKYVVGMIFDKDALMSHFDFLRVRTTPVEARKGYTNTWYTFAEQYLSSTTENTIVYYMAS